MEGLSARALDFAPAMTAGEIAQAVIDELQRDSADLEVGHASAKARFAFRTERAPIDAGHAGLTVGADWVMLITGGARGITAKIAEAAATPDRASSLLAERRFLRQSPMKPRIFETPALCARRSLRRRRPRD